MAWDAVSRWRRTPYSEDPSVFAGSSHYIVKRFLFDPDGKFGFSPIAV
jgi:hypothetical protein